MFIDDHIYPVSHSDKSVDGDPQDLFDQPLLLDMIFVGTPYSYVVGCIFSCLTKCPFRNTLL